MKEEAFPRAVPLITTAEITLHGEERAEHCTLVCFNLKTPSAFSRHQMAPVSEGCSVRHEDDTLGKAEAHAVDIGLPKGGAVRCLQLLLVRRHKGAFPRQACDGPDVAQRLAGHLHGHFIHMLLD